MVWCIFEHACPAAERSTAVRKRILYFVNFGIQNIWCFFAIFLWLWSVLYSYCRFAVSYLTNSPAFYINGEEPFAEPQSKRYKKCKKVCAQTLQLCSVKLSIIIKWFKFCCNYSVHALSCVWYKEKVCLFPVLFRRRRKNPTCYSFLRQFGVFNNALTIA